jgi:peptidoglycan-associated lipoprotein
MKTGEGAAPATQEKGEAEKIVMTPGMEDEIDAFENEYIYFDYDKFTLTPEAEATLSNKSRFIKARPEVRVEIQGHCDERGTTAYNMALGERRAKAARDYLVSSGIAEDILTAVSYGEERPVDPGQNEQAWAKNRRGQFVISNK